MQGSTSVLVFAGLVTATGIMRLGELVVSFRRLRVQRDALVAEPRMFPLMVVLHAGLLALPLLEVVLLDRPFLVWLAVLSAGTLVVATIVRVWALGTLRRAWNVRIVRPEAKDVVLTGPYAWIRHPNYLAVILEIAALPLFHTAWLSAIALSALNAFVLFHRIRAEERTLDAIPAWGEAMKDRPRFFPRLF
jgi:methyltransferase